jgi:deltex-like protein
MFYNFCIGLISDRNSLIDPKGTEEEGCSICLSHTTEKKTLHKCGHSFCATCIDEVFKHQKKCPVCSQVYGPLIGNQPSL